MSEPQLALPPLPPNWEPTRLPHHMRPPLPPPQLVRFRPDRPRQPELLRQIEDRNPRSPTLQNPRPKSVTTFKPYQLKRKRGRETFIEHPVEQKKVPPSSNAKQIKHMTKKRDKLNKKIKHSKRKHDNLVSK